MKSPTYTVVNEYKGKKSVYHFDMYRIESEDDLYSIGFDDYIERDGFSIDRGEYVYNWDDSEYRREEEEEKRSLWYNED